MAWRAVETETRGQLANLCLSQKWLLQWCMCDIVCVMDIVKWRLGMSVKIANISGEKWYIGGAPRSRHSGQVLMFRQVDAPYLRLQHTLNGAQFGEGFGYDMAVADFNGDE